MKKTLLITAISFLTFVATTQAQIVNIPDANFKAYLVGNSAINTNLDTEIQVSEASAYTSYIDCPNLNIADLTGISAFTGINSLSCQGNLLTTLDVSANTNLISLSCYGNSLTTLNLSANTNLQSLDCGNNSITSLVLNTSTNLYSLNCSYNLLSTLDVSIYGSLMGLFCRNNQLTSLNMANGNNTGIGTFTAINNPGLTCIEVDNAVYSTTNWTNIDGTASFSEDCSSSTGIDNIFMGNKILYYPNPTTGAIFLSDNYNVTISDITGKTILVKSNTNNLDISKQPTGLYFLMLTDDNGQFVQQGKVIKE